MGRLRWIGFAVFAALAAAAPGARAATVDVTASNFQFSPASVTITQGDMVTWSNPNAGFHNVHFDVGSFQMPMMPTAIMWTVSQTFSTPGTYTYACDAHRSIGMTGTVVVNAAPSGGGGPPGSNPAPLADLGPPVVSSLASPAKQHVGRLFVRASMNEAGTLAATGTVGVPGGAAKVYRFRVAKRTVAANEPVKLRLKLSKRARHLIRLALLQHKLRARVTVTATDATQKQTIRRLTIRLTR